MPTIDEYLARPLADRLARLGRTPDELVSAIRGADDAVLFRRPEPRSWSATEVLCHLRDVEELFLVRFQSMLAMDDPMILTFGAAPGALAAWKIGAGVGHPLDPDRWAEEREYGRCRPDTALAAFTRRRAETLTVLRGLTPAEWRRGGVHLQRGRMALGDWVGSLAAHDDNHLAQLGRTLDGRA